MYTLMMITEYVGIIMLVLELFYVMYQKKSYMQNLLLILVISCLINFIGYLFELHATNQETALLSVKFAYLGKPFIVLSIFSFVLSFCKINLSGILRSILIGVHALITVLVLTCESHDLFYSSIDFTYEGSFPHLVLGHGIFYYAYMLLLFLYFITMVVLGIRKIKMTKDWLVKRQMILCITMVVICITGFILFLSGNTAGYDTTLLSYFICVQILMVIMVKYQLFNTLSFAREDATENMPEAIIVFDNDEEIIYMNRNARLLKEYVDKKYSDSLFFVLSDFEKKQRHLIVENGNIFVGDRSDYQGEYNLGNSAYHIMSRKITRKNITYGQTFVVRDETDSYYYTKRLKREVKGKTREIVRMQRNIIGSFASMIEARDGITGLHIKNTSNFVRVLSHAMMTEGKYQNIVTEEYAQMVTEAANLHDIGKISIPDEVLQKPGKLTDEEFAIMKTHPTEGARIIRETLAQLENKDYVKLAYDMAYYHHEKFAGGGYPCNLKGEEIPLSARIMAICDVYDALRSKRHYKDGFPVEKAVSIIRESKGTHFDPDIADVFLQHVDEMESVFLSEDNGK